MGNVFEVTTQHNPYGSRIDHENDKIILDLFPDKRIVCAFCNYNLIHIWNPDQCVLDQVKIPYDTIHKIKVLPSGMILSEIDHYINSKNTHLILLG